MQEFFNGVEKWSEEQIESAVRELVSRNGENSLLKSGLALELMYAKVKSMYDQLIECGFQVNSNWIPWIENLKNLLVDLQNVINLIDIQKKKGWWIGHSEYGSNVMCNLKTGKPVKFNLESMKF